MSHDWSAFHDDDGQLFYYNSVTEESSWDPPADGHFNPPPAPGNESHEEDAVSDKAEKANEETTAGWVAYQDDEGQTYYYNATTGETQWEKPDELKEDSAPEKRKKEEEAEEAEEGEEIQQNEQESDTAKLNDASNAAEEETATRTVANEPETDEAAWIAYKDDEGREFYYNATTGETQWEKPDEPVAIAPEEPETTTENQQEPENDDDDDDGFTSGPVEAMDDEEIGPETTSPQWMAYKDEEGREFYYNSITGETQWEKPEDGMVVAAEEEEEEANMASEEERTGEEPKETANDLKATAEERTTEVEATDQHEPTLPKSPEPDPEPEIDPEVKRVQEAQAALNQTDSILEPGVFQNISIVVGSEGNNPAKALSAIVDSYHGQSAVCGILGRWLAELRTPNSTASTKTVPAQAAADEVREIVQSVLNRFVKERFSKEVGDRILNLEKKDAAFLEEMMDSPKWRKLLIDLSAIHKDSAVLIYCLQSISKRGHHREISKRVNQSDHFAVFNAMLQSELTNIGNVSISAESDVASSVQIEELINDLKRACCSTSYTYLYTLEALRHLEERAKEAARQSPSKSRFQRAIRKWSAFAQSLENAMVDPSSSSFIGGSSTLFRKRRLDVALAMSELHQRQRRRLKYDSEGVGSNGNNGDGDTVKQLETALLNFLKRHSVGTQLNDAALDPLLPMGVDLTSYKDTGRLLVEHPLAVRALLEHLFKPGSTRVVAPVLRNKCARLVAFAVLAAEDAYEQESSQSESSDEVTLTRIIGEASQLCEQLETMVSFLVVVEDSQKQKGTSGGEKLCNLAFKCAAIAQGAVIWAKNFSHGAEFATSPAFPTISVSILSLLRVMSVRYPFTRGDAADAAANFLSHSNRDISYQKVTALKEQSLRLLIILLLEGEIAGVLSRLLEKLENHRSSELDASLVRYFVGGVLECVEPPFSAEFVRSFGLFLRASKCVDAIRSTHFTDSNKEQLKVMLRSFQESALPEDQSLVRSLLSIYRIELA